jgi:hypothetical protein
MRGLAPILLRTPPTRDSPEQAQNLSNRCAVAPPAAIVRQFLPEAGEWL